MVVRGGLGKTIRGITHLAYNCLCRRYEPPRQPGKRPISGANQKAKATRLNSFSISPPSIADRRRRRRRLCRAPQELRCIPSSRSLGRPTRYGSYDEEGQQRSKDTDASTLTPSRATAFQKWIDAAHTHLTLSYRQTNLRKQTYWERRGQILTARKTRRKGSLDNPRASNFKNLSFQL